MKRRDLLKTTMSAGMLAAPFLHIRPARADKGELVVVSWGGGRRPGDPRPRRSRLPEEHRFLSENGRPA